MKKECDLQKNGPDEKNQEANLKKGGSKIEEKKSVKKITTKFEKKEKRKKNFKRSENLMENKIKKCVIEKKKGKKHVTISPKYVFEWGKKGT